MASRSTPNPHRAKQVKKLRVIVDAQELEKHTYIKCRNGHVFPKKDRGGLPSRMMDEVSEAVACIMDANEYDLRDLQEGETRLSYQRQALRELQKLSYHIELAYDITDLSDDEFEYWSLLAVEVRRRCAAWHKSDKKRYRELHHV